ncbi:MAG: TraC family protein [Campylobacterota bacterium]|nr:TraC family protein [Campylobacterota bacterium]
MLDSLLKPKTLSINANAWRKLFERNHLSEYLPYATFDETTNIYEGLDNQYGAIFECVPRISMGSSTAVTIQEMLEKLPRTVHLQIIMFGSRNSEDLISAWEHDHCRRAEHDDAHGHVLKTAIKNMAGFYRQKHYESVGKQMVAKLRKYHLYFVLKSEDFEDLRNTKAMMSDLLGSNNFHPRAVSPYDLKPMLWEIWNGNHFKKDENGDTTPSFDIPEYEEAREINRQIIESDTVVEFRDDCVIADKRYWKVLSPSKLSSHAHLFDFGMRLGDYVSNVMDTNQFNDSFLLTLNIKRLPKKDTEEVKRNHGIINGQPWPDVVREFHKRKDESGSILDRINNNEELFVMDMNVCVSGDTQEEMNFNAESIMSYWNKGGDKSSIKLTPIDGVHQLALIASMPLGINDEYYDTTRKFYKLFGEQLTQYLPLEADYAGTHPNMMLFSRRAQLAGLDLFESDNNYNGYVIATSGSGKSVFLNILAFQSYARDDIVFIVDIGNSYKKQCEVVGGQYIEPDPKNPKSINPFSDIKSMEQMRDDLEYLSSFVYMLGASKSVRKSEEVEKLIKTRLQQVILELFEEFRDDLEVTYIRDRLMQEDDRRLLDFAAQLGSYCRGGIYEGFMCGRNEIDMQAEFIVAELGKVENEEAIRDPLIMIMLYHVGNKLYHGDNDKKMQMIFDEAHKFLGKNPRMDDFIEQAYRRARKHGASVIIATQGFDDIYSAHGGLSRAGTTIVNNSSWKFFLKQTGTSINMLIQSGVFSFSPLDEDVLRSIRTIKPQFSELFVITPDETKVPFRLVMDKYFYYLTSTNQDDKMKISKIAEEYGIGDADAIEILVQLENDKAAAEKKRSKAQKEAA